MALPAFVNKKDSGALSGTSVTSISTGAYSLTAGNLSVVVVRANPAVVTGVTDSAGNTYTKDGDDGPSGQQSVWSCPNALGSGTNNVTATYSSGQTFTGICAMQFSGAATASPLNVFVSGQTAAGVSRDVSATPTGTVFDQIVVAAASLGAGDTWSIAPSGFTQDASQGSNAYWHRIESTNYFDGTRTVTATAASSTAIKRIVVAIYKAASTGPATKRVSQLAVEVINKGASEIRASQLAVEVINKGASEIRASQFAVEVLTPNSVSAQRITQLAAEVVSRGLHAVQVSQLAIEVISRNQRPSSFPALLLSM